MHKEKYVILIHDTKKRPMNQVELFTKSDLSALGTLWPLLLSGPFETSMKVILTSFGRLEFFRKINLKIEFVIRIVENQCTIYNLTTFMNFEIFLKKIFFKQTGKKSKLKKHLQAHRDHTKIKIYLLECLLQFSRWKYKTRGNETNR